MQTIKTVAYLEHSVLAPAFIRNNNVKKTENHCNVQLHNFHLPSKLFNSVNCKLCAIVRYFTISANRKA